jgi:hypothetical protein
MEAVQALLDSGVEIGSVPVILSPANTDPIKLVIQNVKKNLNRRFTFFETSFQVMRLLGIGKSKADIVELMGLTDVAVLDFINDVPKPIREHVKLGRISGTEALRICRQPIYRKDQDKAIAKVEEMIEKAESEGRSKASRKDDPDSEPVKSLSGRGRGRPRGKAGTRVEPDDNEDDDEITEDLQWTKFPEPRPMPGRKLLSPVRFLASEGDEFSIADIRNFKNLFGDLEWFRLDEDRPQIGIALVDVEFVAYMVVPSDALESDTGPEDPEEDEEEDEPDDLEDEDEAELEGDEGGEDKRERAAASADL